MNADDLHAVMVRDLRALAREVSAYPSDALLWQEMPGITNTGGNLALHLAGNVRHFFGAVLGASGWVRDREREFNARGIARAVVVAEIELAIAEVDRVIPALGAATLAAPFPVEVLGRRLPTARFLMHLCSHFAYHLGQIDYHRRIVAPASGTAGTMSLTEL
ncbi:MAG: DinB family protein [Gemmatimonadetes bacterium]|nr:DinB family protein [Gemmatimonadota bacterium]